MVEREPSAVVALMQGSYITYGGKRLMAIPPGQGMVIDPTGTFSTTDPRSDVWSLLPIPSSELRCRQDGPAPPAASIGWVVAAARRRPVHRVDAHCGCS